jgi:TatA/E family protein of Tat protein translocase
MPDIGWQELLIVLIVALVIFGPKRLPDLGRSLGKGVREFRNATQGIQEHLDARFEDAPEQVTPATTAPEAEVVAGEVVREEIEQPATRATA